MQENIFQIGVPILQRSKEDYDIPYFIFCSQDLLQPNLQDSPDENTLAVVSLPQAAVALVGHSEDMRRQLPHVMFAVQVDSSAIVQACYLLIGIYCCQN